MYLTSNSLSIFWSQVMSSLEMASGDRIKVARKGSFSLVLMDHSFTTRLRPKHAAPTWHRCTLWLSSDPGPCGERFPHWPRRKRIRIGRIGVLVKKHGVSLVNIALVLLRLFLPLLSWCQAKNGYESKVAAILVWDLGVWRGPLVSRNHSSGVTSFCGRVASSVSCL